MMPDSGHTKLTTARSVTALRPRADRYVVRDTRVSGLELRVSPDGRKLWTLRYRNAAKQQRRMNLGKHPRVSLAAARKCANAELRKLDHGLDPQAERQQQRRAAEQAQKDSIDALCAAYLDRHAKPKKRTWRDDQSTIRRELLPHWKGRAVSSILRRDCRELVQAIADRPAPISANRVAALLSRLFRFAVDEEIIAANPAAHLPKPGVEAAARPDGEREPKAYTAAEIRAIWQATATLTPALTAMYRLGLLTGQRPNEITGMTWAEIDGAWWTIPGRRTKNSREHRVFLVPAALDLLRDLPRHDGDDHVFAGWRGKRQLAAINQQVFATVRRREKPRHAFRDTVATGLAAAGIAVEDIAKVLNHAYGPRVTAGYNAYLYDREKRLALSKWARRLTAILDEQPQQAGESVVAFPAAERQA
jgi:integrase